MPEFAIKSEESPATLQADATPHGDQWINLELRAGLVSVVIPTYNRCDLISETLRSVTAQTYRPIEVIVVDDGSVDRTRAVVDSIALKLADDSQLTIKYVFQPNAGAPAARNHGTRLASGEFIQYLDSDDILESRKIELQVHALLGAHSAAFAYGPIKELENPARTIYCQTEMSWERLVRKSIATPAMQTAGPLSRRSMIASLGPWNEAIAPMEDWEYYSRAAVSGLHGVYTENAITLHRMDVADRLRWTGKPGTVDKFVVGRVGQLESMLSHACDRALHLSGFHDLIAWNLMLVSAFGVSKGWIGDDRLVYRRASQIARGALPRLTAATMAGLSRSPLRSTIASLLLAARWLYYRTIFKLPGERV